MSRTRHSHGEGRKVATENGQVKADLAYREKVAWHDAQKMRNSREPQDIKRADSQQTRKITIQRRLHHNEWYFNKTSYRGSKSLDAFEN